MKKILSLSVAALLPMLVAAQDFKFNLGQRGPEIYEDYYGIFFEELSHSGEGDNVYLSILIVNGDVLGKNGYSAFALQRIGIKVGVPSVNSAKLINFDSFHIYRLYLMYTLYHVYVYLSTQIIKYNYLNHYII